MTNSKERILLVENDPNLVDVIARQTLQPMGYRVDIAQTADSAIQSARQNEPDVILAELNLPGLSGKDLLVALSSQKIDVPVVVLAEKDAQGDILQSFRLGATDFLHHPFREAELLSAVERALANVRIKREREKLACQLQQTNKELQQRIRELTTIFAIGKAVTSITHQGILLEKLMEAAVFVTDAELGWILLREDQNQKFLLSASKNLPDRLQRRINRSWNDGISTLVAGSKESLMIHGEPIRRFPIVALGAAALVVPIKARQEVLGIMVVMRKANKPFKSENQVLLESVADYASISLVNAKLFKHLQEQAAVLKRSADIARMGEKIKDDLFQQASREISKPLESALDQIMALMGDHIGKLTADQKEALRIASEQLGYMIGLADTLDSQGERYLDLGRSDYDINFAAREAMARFEGIALQRGIILDPHLYPKPLKVIGNPSHLTRVLESLISNALKFSPKGGRVTVTSELVDQEGKLWVHASVQDSGCGMSQEQISFLWEAAPRGSPTQTGGEGGLGMRLPLAKEVVALYGGKLWLSSVLDTGTTVHLMLPSIQ